MLPSDKAAIMSHYPFMQLNSKRTLKPHNVKPGQVIRFHYHSEDRIVFVLNPDYEEFMHCLSLHTVHRSALVSEILSKWNSRRDPELFYVNAIRKQSEDYPKSYRAYRTFTLAEMTDIRLLNYSFTNQRF